MTIQYAHISSIEKTVIIPKNHMPHEKTDLDDFVSDDEVVSDEDETFV